MIRIEKILYPTDFSSYSNQAYFHAIALAENHGASLTVLFVFSPEMDAPEAGQDRAAARRYWQAQLQQIRPLNPRLTVNHVFLEGDPATEIVRFCKDAGMDLVVMGTHGRSGMERLLMGSVAEKVMRDAPGSVLVVKLPRGVPAAHAADVAVAAKPK